jgi:hypothetical protein
VPVTLIVFPFFTQVIVFFLLDVALAEGDALGVGIALTLALELGELDGDGATISAALIDGEAKGDATALAEGDAVTAAAGAAVGSKLMSYETFPSASLTFLGKLSGNGVSERCFMTERTSGRKFGNTCSAP